jgi:hypothetical protein
LADGKSLAHGRVASGKQERPGPSNTQQPGLGDALTATAEEATVATTAAKAMAGAEAIAEIAFALASQAWVQVTAAADLTFANSSIDASLTASNDAVDAVHAYVVASIGVNLIASTAATGFALLREHSAINAMTTAQKAAINAACTATLANLASDLTGRNASEALDDPIAIAAATNNAAQAVKAAWQNVNNLQSRAASTFAGMGPGGFAMTFAGFTGWVGDQFDVVWAGGVGLFHGGAIVVNSLTFGSNDSLNGYVDGLIEANGGFYGTAQGLADAGTTLLTVAGGMAAVRTIAGLSLRFELVFNRPMLAIAGMSTSGGTVVWPIAVSGTQVLQAGAAGVVYVYMTGRRMPAAENKAVYMAKQIEKELGKDARQLFHDMKIPGMGNRTLQELIADAIDIYRTAGREIPSWLKNMM